MRYCFGVAQNTPGYCSVLLNKDSQMKGCRTAMESPQLKPGAIALWRGLAMDGRY